YRTSLPGGRPDSIRTSRNSRCTDASSIGASSRHTNVAAPRRERREDLERAQAGAGGQEHRGNLTQPGVTRGQEMAYPASRLESEPGAVGRRMRFSFSRNWAGVPLL